MRVRSIESTISIRIYPLDIKSLNNIVFLPVYFTNLTVVDPLAVQGSVAIARGDDSTHQLTEDFILPISRIQLEQDTAKTTKPSTPTTTPDSQTSRLTATFQRLLLDHNRSSVPLIEIITPPTLTSPHQAATAFAKVAEILRATGVTTADLHLGAMRCDVNISLGLSSARTEIKNLFSTRAVRDSCAFEIQEQIRMFQNNQKIEQCTKTWSGRDTVMIRKKEGERDYR